MTQFRDIWIMFSWNCTSHLLIICTLTKRLPKSLWLWTFSFLYFQRSFESRCTFRTVHSIFVRETFSRCMLFTIIWTYCIFISMFYDIFQLLSPKRDNLFHFYSVNRITWNARFCLSFKSNYFCVIYYYCGNFALFVYDL